MILVDANLLIYAVNQDAPLNRKAKPWLESILSGKETVGLPWNVLLAFLRLSGWDYKRFRECLPVLKKGLQGLNETQKQELYEVILNVWDGYMPIGEEYDLAFQIGTLLLEMDYFAEALEFL